MLVHRAALVDQRGQDVPVAYNQAAACQRGQDLRRLLAQPIAQRHHAKPVPIDAFGRHTEGLVSPGSPEWVVADSFGGNPYERPNHAEGRRMFEQPFYERGLSAAIYTFQDDEPAR
jgi:hypothetical protein